MSLFEMKDTLIGTARRHGTYKPTIAATISELAGVATGFLLASKSDRAARKTIRAMAIKGAAISAEYARRTARLTNDENSTIES